MRYNRFGGGRGGRHGCNLDRLWDGREPDQHLAGGRVRHHVRFGQFSPRQPMNIGRLGGKGDFDDTIRDTHLRSITTFLPFISWVVTAY